jgi:hypothetical protein
MPSSTFLDHPVLKVSRPVAACLRCRTAKIKCDGKLPACSACEKAGKDSTCSGATDEFAKGKERSYVASLEGYCEKLEKRLAELRRRKEAQGSNTNSGQEVPQSSITAFAAENSSSRAHRKEVRDIDDLVGDFGFLYVSNKQGCLPQCANISGKDRSMPRRETSMVSRRMCLLHSYY